MSQRLMVQMLFSTSILDLNLRRKSIVWILATCIRSYMVTYLTKQRVGNGHIATHGGKTNELVVSMFEITGKTCMVTPRVLKCRWTLIIKLTYTRFKWQLLEDLHYTIQKHQTYTSGLHTMDNIASLFTIIHPPALSGIPMLASSNKHSIHFREFQFSPILDFCYYTGHIEANDKIQPRCDAGEFYGWLGNQACVFHQHGIKIAFENFYNNK
ncbi:hypothetical protein MAR_034350 [Mya arenaria]|uniref:Uncharacterized protein n=1 Tax=Mya arenaria TaxID=6604 RepID=A0ABY7GF05_MYAAR|nr:hypothetical protein MAR_034350 [Mya arenaria]